MKDRIRELWAQCVIKHTKTPMNWQDVADELAELIVGECIREVEGLQVDDWNEHWNSAIGHASLHLKEHFGVEE